MKTRWIVLTTTALLIVASAPACKKKPANKKADETSQPTMAAMNAMTPAMNAMGPAMAARPGPAMAARPAAGLTPELKKQIMDLTAKITGKDWKARREARKALKVILKKNAKNVALANFLAAQPSYQLADEGMRLWENMKSDKTKLDGFVAAMRSAFGHKSDRIRHRAVRAFWIRVDKEVRAKVAADVRKLFADPSCLVRRAARDFTRSLLQANHKQDDAKKLALEALSDTKCPIVQIWAADQLRGMRVAKYDPKIAAALQKLAATSSFYQLRCQALRALAVAKHPATKRLAKPFFKIPAATALVAYYVDGHSPYTFNIIAPTMAECAMRALADFEGKPYPSGTKKALAFWAKLAKRHLASRPPAKACLGKKTCGKDQFCVAYSCKTAKQAKKAYWQYRRLSRCYHEDKAASHKNFTSPPRVKSGLGTHFMAEWGLKKLYRKADEKKFAAQDKKIREMKCPAK